MPEPVYSPEGYTLEGLYGPPGEQAPFSGTMGAPTGDLWGQILEGFKLGQMPAGYEAGQPGGACIKWTPIRIGGVETGASWPSPGGDFRECLFDWLIALAGIAIVAFGLFMVATGAGQASLQRTFGR